ncbi:MAG: cysteine-rich small domain-containing protein [Coriobacteriales bacterium]|jgi:Zn-finger protein|nr:cysteine-rich small domain-containing protein [Coriobacteriales bacterium]MDO5709909.1 cysteine-rich small domain-containing protein [Coriobacteriales bacterium]
MECSAQPPKSGATFFRNVDCPYFPCHAGVDPMWFNCLFCYCPLYALGPRCGGDFTYTDNGIKDCSRCTRLHEGDAGIHLVKKHFAALAELARLNGPRGSELPE